MPKREPRIRLVCTHDLRPTKIVDSNGKPVSECTKCFEFVGAE